jgi:phosphoribosylanthranilate isomerase
MKIKVCGMKYPDNIRALLSLPIDYMGFIFYDRSPRWVGDADFADIAFPPSVSKTGVFVNESPEKMLACIDRCGLDAIQLHGSETPAVCRSMQHRGVEVIKAFGIGCRDDLDRCRPYAGWCDYFLFDTRTSQHGGSGRQFDWETLQYYREGVPFFLSGGIGVNDAENLRSLRHASCYGIDLNSRFEVRPGLKDIARLEQFLKTIKTI